MNITNIKQNYNYFENEFFKIKTMQNKFKDKFEIILNYENEQIIVKRIDINPKDAGWGQDLKLSVYNKILLKTEIIQIGSSKKDEITINYKINKDELTNKYFFENNTFKIYHKSFHFNDIFKINYLEDVNILSIKRVDANEGWGDNLYCYIVYKKTNEEKPLYIGSSNYNELLINIDLLKLFNIDVKDNNNINKNIFYFDNYIITLHNFEYNDIFEIIFYEENQTLFIKRNDVKEGWGANLILNIYNKNENYNYLIYIGSSSVNEIYKKINLIQRKVYVSLTTIPSRIKLKQFFDNINDLLINQTYPIEKIFITIPYKYKRFNEEIDENIINELKKIDKVHIIRSNEDYGPSSKYLCPLLEHYKELEDNLLVIIDDDRIYNKNLIKNFVISYNSNPNIIFSSGYWKDYFNSDYKNYDEEKLNITFYKEKNNNKFFFGQGLGGFYGFCIKISNLDKFIDYNLKVLKRIPKSFYHDEGIILGYLKYKEEIIMYLNHKGCNFINDEMIDALCESNLVNRGNIEKEILQITNLEKLL